MTSLENKVALVSGAAGVLGSAIADAFVREGAAVVLTDVQVEAGRRLAERLGCTFIRQDVTKETDWAVTMSEVMRLHGSLHILINNAGVEGPFDAADPETTRLGDWQLIHRVNVEGVFLGCRAAIPVLRNSGGGAIVNVSSMAGVVATPDFVAYGASKAAVRHLTKSIALYCARQTPTIRCNSIHPGVVESEMVGRIAEGLARKHGTSREHELAEFRARAPNGQLQTAQDVANAVLFLVSEQSSHISGVGLRIDDGCSEAV